MAKNVERRDTNTPAFNIVQQATGQQPRDGKNKTAVTPGRTAHAKSLTMEQKKAIAEKAARARWHSRKAGKLSFAYQSVCEPTKNYVWLHDWPDESVGCASSL